MVRIPIIIITVIVLVVFIITIVFNKRNENNPEIDNQVDPDESIKVYVPNFINDFVVNYSKFDANGNVLATYTLPRGKTSKIILNFGYITLNIKQISTGKIVSTYNYNNNYIGTIPPGTNLTVDINNTIKLPGTIITVVNNIK
jgi:hypothetical protein